MGTSCVAGVGASGSQLRWQGVRAVREGETGGFPLIIYSLSLGNQAASTAKLSLPAPGPLEASGWLSSLSGYEAPGAWRRLSTVPQTCRSAPTATHTPSQRSRAARAVGDRDAAGVVTAPGKSPSSQTLCPHERSSKAWPRGPGFISCLAQAQAGSLEDQRPFKSPGNGMLYNLQNQPLACLRAAASINVLRSPSAPALGH